jgi:hypothetical protein
VLITLNDRDKIDLIEEKQSKSSEEISKLLLGTVKENRKWQADIVKHIHEQNWHPKDREDVQEFSAMFTTFTEDKRQMFIEHDILRRLHFQTMHDRQERIPKAFQNTFEWVFNQTTTIQGEEPFDSYVQWLQGNQSVYWVTGKPGAGKSTLMKYLFNDARSPRYASDWNKSAELVSAGFFFWNSGTALQMSGEGLLQTLLFQVLDQRRDLIPKVFSDSWRSYELLGGDVVEKWSWSDLVKALKMLIADTRFKYLFFVDGLDEFSGDHTDLVNFLLEISKTTNVKLCVSSRPWLAFEEAFGKRPRLRIETLTKSDILHFVSMRLRMSQRFRDLELNEPSEAELLIQEVTSKAHGVFLWVYLVIRSLSEGLRDGDTMKDLLARISRLPSDLEELFRKILDHLDATYFEQASILFQLMAAAVPRPLTVLSFAFAEEGFDAAMTATVGPLNPGQLSSRAETIRRRLNSRSKGLLEATPTKSHPERAQVQYLHRTVKDFLARRDIWIYIISGTSVSFNASKVLCGTYLLELKKLQEEDGNFRMAWKAIRGCLDHATRAYGDLQEQQLEYFDEMDKAARQVYKSALSMNSHAGSSIPHWVDTLSGSFETAEDCRSWLECYPCASFLEFAASYGLYAYAEGKIGTKEVPIEQQLKGCTLLCVATRRRDVRLINYLIEKGAKPNATGKHGTSAWQELLQVLDYSYCDEPEVWYKLVMLFLDHGANPEAVANSTPAFQIIETSFGGWNIEQTKEVFRRMLAMRPSLKRRKDWPRALMKSGKSAKYIQVEVKKCGGVGPRFQLPAWIDRAATNNTMDEP